MTIGLNPKVLDQLSYPSGFDSESYMDHVLVIESSVDLIYHVLVFHKYERF